MNSFYTSPHFQAIVLCALRQIREVSIKTGISQGRRTQMDIGGAGKSVNLGGSGGMDPQIILKSRTPEIRFLALWEVIFYRKAHHKLEIWERVDRD